MISKLSFDIQPKPKTVVEQPGYTYACKSLDFYTKDRTALNASGHEVFNREDKTVWFRRKPKIVHFKPRRIVRKPISRIRRFVLWCKLMRRLSKTFAFKFLVVVLSMATWVISIYVGITFAYAAVDSMKVIPDEPVKMMVAFKNQAKPEVLSMVAPQAPQTVSNKILNKFGTSGPLMLAVADCESHLNPNAVGDTTLQYYQNGVRYGASYGIFQIRYLPGRPAPYKLMDPDFNIQYAYDMFKKQGARPWTCYTRGYYKKHLK